MQKIIDANQQKIKQDISFEINRQTFINWKKEFLEITVNCEIFNLTENNFKMLQKHLDEFCEEIKSIDN